MPINHVVVLMLENRSFDHMLGFMKTQDWPINGLTGNESNYPDPLNPTGTPVPMKPSATYVPDLDPGPMHDYANVVRQIHGGSNAGFVADYLTITDAARAGLVMTGFAPDKLPVLATLAKEFAVCDNWFSSLPGPTWPNRFFVHCATAGGYVDGAPRNYPMRTLYQNLSDAHVNWRIYYHDIPQSLALQNQRRFFHAQYEIYNQSFVRDCRQGRLPQYSFIEPRYFNEGSSRANDQHPIHGVVGGELLIADIYEAVRSSPNWNETVLIITYDEHGGFYDHVPPPAATPPDPPNPAQQFDFASYGVRVPAVVISPLIPKGTIDRTLYDHASIAGDCKETLQAAEVPHQTRRRREHARAPMVADDATHRRSAHGAAAQHGHAPQRAASDARGDGAGKAERPSERPARAHARARPSDPAGPSASDVARGDGRRSVQRVPRALQRIRRPHGGQAPRLDYGVPQYALSAVVTSAADVADCGRVYVSFVTPGASSTTSWCTTDAPNVSSTSCARRPSHLRSVSTLVLKPLSVTFFFISAIVSSNESAASARYESCWPSFFFHVSCARGASAVAVTFTECSQPAGPGKGLVAPSAASGTNAPKASSAAAARNDDDGIVPLGYPAPAPTETDTWRSSPTPGTAHGLCALW